MLPLSPCAVRLSRLIFFLFRLAGLPVGFYRYHHSPVGRGWPKKQSYPSTSTSRKTIRFADGAYVRPEFTDGGPLAIKDGRHPVREVLSPGVPYVPNDTFAQTDQNLLVISGPNMAGKSTYIRFVAGRFCCDFL